MMNGLYNEDCRETLKRELLYDYVITSPPDLNELGYEKIDASSIKKWRNFLISVIKLLKPKKGFVSICISDRKSGGEIISKHSIVMDIFKDLGYKLHTHKLWIKSRGVNLYRLNYMHLLTFTKGAGRQSYEKFRPDVFFALGKWQQKGYTYGMPAEIVSLLIKNYTDEGDTVYDPFMGSGTTAVSCISHKRLWVGSEISKTYCDIMENRIAKQGAPLPGMEDDYDT